MDYRPASHSIYSTFEGIYNVKRLSEQRPKTNPLQRKIKAFAKEIVSDIIAHRRHPS